MIKNEDALTLAERINSLNNVNRQIGKNNAQAVELLRQKTDLEEEIEARKEAILNGSPYPPPMAEAPTPPTPPSGE